MNGKHISNYRSKGYICQVGDIIEVKIFDLPKNSHVLIDVKCDVCGSLKKIKYQVYSKNILGDRYYGCSIKCSIDKSKDTFLQKYGVENPMKDTSIVENMKLTFLKNYGVTNPNKNSKVREKISNTNLEKYGVENPFQMDSTKDKIKMDRISTGKQISDDLLSDFEIYRRKVDNLTSIIKKSILEEWDGFDYYDREYIKDNFNLKSNSRNYPHFDHKISVLYGFKNGIDFNKIANSSNICVTKGYINSKKSYLTEQEFIEKLSKHNDTSK
jgi:hypothetical protein